MQLTHLMEPLNDFCKTCTEYSFSQKCIDSLNKDITAMIKDIQQNAQNHDTAILFFGLVQVGKTYLLNLLLQENLKIVENSNGDITIANNGVIDDDILQIGNGEFKTTYFPNIRTIEHENNKICFVDLPGFDNFQSIPSHCYFNKRLVVNFAINMCVNYFKNIKIAVLIDSTSLKNANSHNSWGILQTVFKKFGSHYLDQRVALFFTKNEKFTKKRISEIFLENIDIADYYKIYFFLKKETFCFLNKPTDKQWADKNEAHNFFKEEREKTLHCLMNIRHPSQFLPDKQFDLDKENLDKKVFHFISLNTLKIGIVIETIKSLIDNLPKTKKDKFKSVSQICLLATIGGIMQNSFFVLFNSFFFEPDKEIQHDKFKLNSELIKEFIFQLSEKMEKFEKNVLQIKEWCEFLKLIAELLTLVGEVFQNYNVLTIYRNLCLVSSLNKITIDDNKFENIFKSIMKKFLKNLLKTISVLQAYIGLIYGVRFYFQENVVENIKQYSKKTLPQSTSRSILIEKSLFFLGGSLNFLTGLKTKSPISNNSAPTEVVYFSDGILVDCFCIYEEKFLFFKINNLEKNKKLCAELNECFEIIGKSAEIMFNKQKKAKSKSFANLLKNQMFSSDIKFKN